MDWHQIWQIVSAPDNVPIVGLLFLVPFYLWYGLRQSVANDRLIAQLETDPKLAATHHRKTQPYKAGWEKEVHVWPFLLRIEFLAAIIVTVVLLVWSTLAVNLIHAYDPEVLILGGGIMASADVVLPAVRAHVDRYAHTPWGKVRVVASELGDAAALVAGEWLLQEQLQGR